MHRTIHIPACCPHKDCGKSLITDKVKVGRRPSVHLIAEKDGVRGDIYLSSWYDDFRAVEPEELNIRPGDVVKFFCPHCGKELPVADKCACKADMVWLAIEGDGRVRMCCRKSCHYHSMEFVDSTELLAFMERMKREKKAKKES